MEQDILFWRGKRIADMDAGELRTALSELFREHEQALWTLHQERQVIAKLGKLAKKAKPSDV